MAAYITALDLSAGWNGFPSLSSQVGNLTYRRLQHGPHWRAGFLVFCV